MATLLTSRRNALAAHLRGSATQGFTKSRQLAQNMAVMRIVRAAILARGLTCLHSTELTACALMNTCQQPCEMFDCLSALYASPCCCAHDRRSWMSSQNSMEAYSQRRRARASSTPNIVRARSKPSLPLTLATLHTTGAAWITGVREQPGSERIPSYLALTSRIATRLVSVDSRHNESRLWLPAAVHFVSSSCACDARLELTL